MKLQYLGTAAAEGFPSLYCVCDTCRRAWEAGGKNIRSRSQSVIDNKLLIDFPPDTYMHMLAHRLPLEKITNCIITHDHSDHFYVWDLENRGDEYAKIIEGQQFNLYGTKVVYEKTVDFFGSLEAAQKYHVTPHLLERFTPVQIGEYLVTPLPATHDPKSDPVIYLIEDKTASLLYAHDTGIIADDVFAYLVSHGKKLDFVSLDCTAGMLTGSRLCHLGLDTCIEMRDKMIETGITKADTRFCLNHFSHNCRATYDEMLVPANQAGFEVSYDGMCVDFYSDK